MLACYAIFHFLTDFACAQWMRGAGAWGLIAYNFCAFALQLPLGMLTDRRGRGAGWAALGLVLTAAAALPGLTPWAVFVTAGIGNALYHLGAGTEVLRMDGGFTRPGVFIAPGALGIALGALSPLPKALTAGLILAAALALSLLSPRSHVTHAVTDVTETVTHTAHSVTPAAAGIFAVVILRSLAGALNGAPRIGGAALLMGAVFLGKALGGILADCFGASRVSTGSLCAAALLWALAEYVPAAGLLALFFFNMTMPVTLRAAARLLPGAEGTAFGALTLALFIGFLPAAAGCAALSGAELSAVCLASAGLLWCSLEALEGGRP